MIALVLCAALGALPAATRPATPPETPASIAAEPTPARAPNPPQPLVCPAGTERRGNAPPEAYEEYCEKVDEGGHALRHGPSRTYYDDGQLWTEATWAEGKRAGPYLEYHRGGARAIEGSYVADGKDGRWTIWFPDARIEERSGWRKNIPDGVYASYWPGGKPRVFGRHCGGAQCGRWTTYDQDGQVVGTIDYGELRDTP